MVDDAELESNVLEFALKSFGYERSVDWDGTSLALFHRRETESESRFRPKVIRLWVVVPRAWILLDPASENLRLARDGRTAGPRTSGEALEAAAQASEFEEQGLTWRRASIAEGGFVYAPVEWADRLLTPEGIRRIALE